MTDMLEKMSSRERQIMDVVFEHGHVSAADVRANMPDAPSDSAVRTMLKRMVEKGYLKQTRDDNRYLYAAAENREEIRSSVLSKMLSTFFDGSVSRAVSGLLGISSEKLTDAEREELKRIIDASKRGEQ